MATRTHTRPHARTHANTRTHTHTTQSTCHVKLFRLLVPVKQRNWPAYSSVGHHFALVSKVCGNAICWVWLGNMGKCALGMCVQIWRGGGGAEGGNTLRCHCETILRCYSQWNVKTTTTHITRSFSCVSWSVGQSVSRSVGRVTLRHHCTHTSTLEIGACGGGRELV